MDTPAVCRCGHLGDRDRSDHENTVQPGHGACVEEGCQCEKFTYMAPTTIVYLSEAERQFLAYYLNGAGEEMAMECARDYGEKRDFQTMLSTLAQRMGVW